MLPPFTSLRSFVSYQFSVLRMRAWRARLWSRLSGRPTELIVFPGDNGRVARNRKLLGTQTIRVADIVGSLNRESDFDSQFRPLKNHTLNRWVDAYLLREQEGWSPILVHKVRDGYFVEDGHHRVSVARALGIDFIEAQVWDYTRPPKPIETCRPLRCGERRPAKSKVYVIG